MASVKSQFKISGGRIYIAQLGSGSFLTPVKLARQIGPHSTNSLSANSIPRIVWVILREKGRSYHQLDRHLKMQCDKYIQLFLLVLE